MIAAVGGHAAVEIPGDFVLSAATHDGGTMLVTSALAATPYYWCHGPDGRLVHGPTVFDVVERAGLAWRWNRDALRALAMLEHPLGAQTLHPAVFRCPPGSLLWTDAHGRLHQRRHFEPRRLFEGPASSMADALAVFRQVHREMDGPCPVVSLSSGLDSRLLLASLLEAGHHPRCATMGGPDATDRQVAQKMAADLGLVHETIELRPHDYLRFGPRAVEVTSGSKPARHFHTFIYAQRLGLSPNDSHHVGSNGEFARSGFFDLGVVARALDAVHAPLMHLTGLVRIHKRTAGSRLHKTPLGGHRLGVAQAFARQTTLASGSLDRLDELLAYQRVRHFIGNGLAMYGDASAVRAPFADVRWMRAVGGLSRRDKLGSNFHRYAIEAMAPALLHYPRGERAGAIAPRAPLSYPLRHHRSVHYAPTAQVLELPEVHERVIDTPQLDAMVPRADRIAAVRDRDAPLCFLLLTLHWTVEVLQRRSIAIASDEPMAGNEGQRHPVQLPPRRASVDLGRPGHLRPSAG